MSEIARWSYQALCTVWPVSGSDEWGQPAFGAPYTLACSWEEGGELKRNANGEEFAPRSVIYFEAPYGDTSIPAAGDYVAVLGDLTANSRPTEEAEQIMRVGGWGAEMFGDPIPDWVIYT